MRAFSLEGPVFGPALFHFVAGDLSRRLPVYSRTPIGYGPRAIVRTDPARITTRRVSRARLQQQRKPRKARAPVYAAFLGVLMLGVAAVGIGASGEPSRALMTRATYTAVRHSIESETRLALAQCRVLEGADKDRCRAQARGDDRVRKAELEARYAGTTTALYDVKLARARAAYEVARASCGDLAGDERVQCLQNARTVRAKALEAANASAT